ncbi:MAG TPA: hypothetical protein VE267_00755 [Bradyrhizobium sp.]|nr:hypothetical protein [Bradyrhizobium sp.]
MSEPDKRAGNYPVIGVNGARLSWVRGQLKPRRRGFEIENTACCPSEGVPSRPAGEAPNGCCKAAAQNGSTGGVHAICPIFVRGARRGICSQGISGNEGRPMRKAAIFLGFAGMCVAISRFLLARLFLTERVDGAIGLLLATGLFTIAIAAVVRK